MHDENSPQHQARKSYFDRLYTRLVAMPVHPEAVHDLFKVAQDEVRALLEDYGASRKDSYDEAGAMILHILLRMGRQHTRIIQKGFLRWFEDELRGALLPFVKREQVFALVLPMKDKFPPLEWKYLRLAWRFLPRWPAPVVMQRILADAGCNLTFAEVVRLDAETRARVAAELGSEWPY
jgi:hypothetical protein